MDKPRHSLPRSVGDSGYKNRVDVGFGSQSYKKLQTRNAKFLSLLCLVTTELWKQYPSTTVTDVDVSYCIMYVLPCVRVLAYMRTFQLLNIYRQGQ